MESDDRATCGNNHIILACRSHKILTRLVLRLFKRLFKRTEVSTLEEIAGVVHRSATVNHPQLVGSYDGTSSVLFYNWTSFFDTKMTALKGITKFHHFRFSAQHHGSVFVKTSSDTVEKEINLLSDKTWKPSQYQLPAVIDPPGLSLERQWYLHNKIREFCSEEARDLVCPQPSTPLK